MQQTCRTSLRCTPTHGYVQTNHQRGWMQPNKQVALKTNKQQTHKGNKTNTWQRPKSKQTSMDPNMNTRKRANKAQTCIKELIQTLCCMDVGLDHKIQIYTLPKSQTQEGGINKGTQSYKKYQAQHPNKARSTRTCRSKHINVVRGTQTWQRAQSRNSNISQPKKPRPTTSNR